jgi:hypothetical protein
VRTAWALAVLAVAAAATEPDARIEFYLRDRKGIRKERFVAAVTKALDKKGLDVKKLPVEYAKTIHGGFFYFGSLYSIEKSGKPRYKKDERDAAAMRAPSVFARKVIHDHKAWLALAATSNKHRQHDYRVLCRIAAELLGDDVLAIHIPERKAWFAPQEKDLAKRLRAKDPFRALGIAPTEAERRATERQCMLDAASKEARRRFGEFHKAYEKAKPGDIFSAWYVDAITGKEELLLVSKVGRDWVEGNLPVRRVWVRDVIDWSYRIGGKRYGDFRMRAIQAYMKKYPPK